MAVVFVVIKQPTDDDKRVAAASHNSDQPDSYTEDEAVQQIGHRRDTVTERMTDSNHRSVATALKRTERPVHATYAE